MVFFRSFFLTIAVVTLSFSLPGHSSETTNLTAIPKKMNLVFLGDSLTAGYGINEEFAFPKLLEIELQKTHPNLKIVNAGESGSTTSSGMGKLKWLLRGNPQIVFLCLGANDGLRGIDAEITEKNLSAMIDMILGKNIFLLFSGMKVPPNYGKEYSKMFERTFDKLVKKYQKNPYFNSYPFLLEGVAGKKDLNLPDGMHPNKKGHRELAKRLKPLFKVLVDNVNRSSGQQES